jgi:hypothetical protein
MPAVRDWPRAAIRNRLNGTAHQSAVYRFAALRVRVRGWFWETAGCDRIASVDVACWLPQLKEAAHGRRARNACLIGQARSELRGAASAQAFTVRFVWLPDGQGSAQPFRCAHDPPSHTQRSAIDVGTVFDVRLRMPTTRATERAS